MNTTRLTKENKRLLTTAAVVEPSKIPLPQTQMKSSPIKEKSPISHHHHPPVMGTWGGSSGGGSRSRGGNVNYKMKYYNTVYKFYTRSALLTFVLTLLCFSGPYPPVVDGGNPDAKRLYDDLLSNYNKLVRPVVNVSEAVTVMLKLKLSQLIDVVSHIQIIISRHQKPFFFGNVQLM
jgi:hypothetical protein